MIPHDRFAFEAFRDGGVLLDLDTGTLFQLNRSAAFVWERTLSNCAPSQILDAFSRFFGVAAEVAQADIAASLALPEQADARTTESEYLYEFFGDCYRVSLAGVPVLEVEASGQALRVLDGMPPTDLPICLAAISPKLVALRGASVLHASAVLRPEGEVTAFIGQSGAGKTTTARAFKRTGLQLVCEDKMVLRLEGHRVEAVLDGESRIVNWLAETRSKLLNGGTGRWCDLDSLTGASSGPASPVTEVMTLHHTRRLGTTIDLFPLGQTAAACELFQHGFYGSSAIAEWRKQIHVAATLARSSRTFRASTPDGIGPLNQAAQRYTEITQS